MTELICVIAERRVVGSDNNVGVAHSVAVPQPTHNQAPQGERVRVCQLKKWRQLKIGPLTALRFDRLGGAEWYHQVGTDTASWKFLLK